MEADVASYQPGRFYLRELPPLRAVLDSVGGLSLLVIDGYADLDPDGRPGLGARARCATRHMLRPVPDSSTTLPSSVPVAGPPGTGSGSNRRTPQEPGLPAGCQNPRFRASSTPACWQAVASSRGRNNTVENAVDAATAENSGQIVVAGAGYAGLHVALRLTAKLRSRPAAGVTLVDQHDYHQPLGGIAVCRSAPLQPGRGRVSSPE